MRALILAPFDERQFARLRRRLDIVYENWLDTNCLWDPEELGARLAADDIAVLIVEADFVLSEVFEAAPGLRMVGVCRNALNQVDIASATAHGVLVTHAPGRNANAVAELALAQMLALARRVPQAHVLVAGGGWRDPATGYRHLRGREIAGSVVGIVGFGQIGRELARKCLALGAKVIASDPYVPARQVRALGCQPAALSDLLAETDFVSLHVPATPATERMVDDAFLAAMKAGAFLVNTAAGSAVDPLALVRALESGRIAGAALDVFEGQPLPLSSPLLTAPNLLLSPHIGGATTETVERQSAMMSAEIARLLAGKALRFAVNPEAQRR